MAMRMKQRTDPDRISDLLISSLPTATEYLLAGLLLLFNHASEVKVLLSSAGKTPFFASNVVTTTIASCIAFLLLNQSKHVSSSSSSSSNEQDSKGEPKQYPYKPLLIPSRTTHTRLFPKKHSFSYSYLLIGVPIGSRGRIGSVLDVDTPSEGNGGFSFFAIKATDFLHRGDDPKGLRGKLDDYLRTQNVDPQMYSSSYLITAPRFLGYSFNPVSFWYLYDKVGILQAMILEVNNTFDERRMYYMKGQSNHAETNAGTFRDSWPKDFHVSPFNSRKGSYSLQAKDPNFSSTIEEVSFNNIITLSSSKDHPKLIATIRSTSAPLNPAKLATFDLFRFVASWWWVGFLTFPRIVKEAGKLFFQRKLHVWFRPEVRSSSIGRMASQSESEIATVFESFLKHSVASFPEPIRLQYEPATNSNTTPQIFASSCASSTTEVLTLRVLSPVFYKHLATSSHTLEYIITSLDLNQNNLDPDRILVHSNNPTSLQTAFKRIQEHSSIIPPTNSPRSLGWTLLSILRGTPPSELDIFTSTPDTTTNEVARSYRRACYQLLISHSLFFGADETLLRVALRGVLVLLQWMHWEVLLQLTLLLLSWGRGQGGGQVPWVNMAVNFAGIYVWCLAGALM